ncbi:MAG: choice-of-anchor L domain-containing protein [Flavobacteriales bacterium]|nr:choice-of-anchor L domain-containing protein [Flavobacteriales bacterium]
MRTSTYLVFVLALLSAFSMSGQCGYGGLNYGDVTPTVPGQTVELLNFAWGGDQFTLQATAGCTYTISTCGTTWDTQLTLFDPALAVEAYNDDFCGLQSTITFTASQTGAYTIQLNQYFCATNTTGAEYFGVTLVNCLAAGGCNLPTACNYNSTDTDDSNCCFGECLTMVVGGGTFDGEISWNIQDEFGATLATGLAPANTFLCLPEGCHTVNLLDSFGDGWNGATWQLTASDGAVVGTGTLLAGSALAVPIQVGDIDCDIPEPPEPIVVDATTYSAQQLISEVFLGECLSASAITFNGADAAIGAFTNGDAIGIEEGIILTTGAAIDAVGPNTTGSVTGLNGSGGSLLLEAMTGDFTYDAVEFTFAFEASTTEVTFDYVFASDEYPEFVCSFNDAFAFFITGPGYATNTNIAVVPGSTDWVSINNVNNNGVACPPYYPAYYIDNVGGTAVEYDGYTVPLQATINTIPCETYQITIAIADAGDSSYDSAVFLKAESFSGGVDVAAAASADSGVQSTPASCEEGGSFVFVNYGEPFTEATTVNFSLTGTALAGVDFNAIPTSVTFQPGETFVILEVDGILDNLDAVAETLTMTMDEVCTCEATSGITLYLCSQLMLPVDWLDFEAELQLQGSEVRCSWEVSSQLNNDFFTVERSKDGISWEPVGTVQGAGTTNQQLSYDWVDKHPLEGVSYYRAKQTDFNGASSFSNQDDVIRVIEEVAIFPNPSNGFFNVSGAQGKTLAVYDARGRVVDFHWIGPSTLSLEGAAAGFYYFEFQSVDGSTERIRATII